MFINPCYKIHINPKLTESIYQGTYKQYRTLYIEDQTVQECSKKTQQVLEGPPNKIQNVDHNIDETISTQNAPRNEWLETVDLKYRFSKK